MDGLGACIPLRKKKFAREILKYYWPETIIYGDIKQTDFTFYRGAIDVLAGGFPCQPYSFSGKKLGKDDDRHLWPEMLRAIREIRPRWVVGENVYGLTYWSDGLVFEEIQSDLEAEGYEVQSYILPAVAVGAPHERNRIWFVAYAPIEGLERPLKQGQYIKKKVAQAKRFSERGVIADAVSERQSQQEYRENETGRLAKTGVPNDWQNFPTQSPIRGRNDGLPSRLDGITFPSWRNQSIEGYGNAIVPQVALQIFEAIEAYEHTH